MTNSQLLILVTVLVICYFCWSNRQKTIAPQTDDIIERKGKEVFYDASDFSDKE